MTESLAKIELPEAGVRAGDALWDVALPRAWFDGEHRATLTLPRRLSCALCEGGGCDACARSGVLDAGSSSEVDVTVPRLTEDQTAVRMRVPGVEALGGGLLLLTLRVAAAPSPGVLLHAPLPDRRVADIRAIRRSVAVALGLGLLFLFLLRFSGWL